MGRAHEIVLFDLCSMIKMHALTTTRTHTCIHAHIHAHYHAEQRMHCGCCRGSGPAIPRPCCCVSGGSSSCATHILAAVLRAVAAVYTAQAPPNFSVVVAVTHALDAVSVEAARARVSRIHCCRVSETLGVTS